MRIQFIKARETWGLRRDLLRPHQPLDEMDYPNDRNPDSFHLGAFEGKDLIGISSFYREKHEVVTGWIQWRLRGMAVVPGHRNSGVAGKMLDFGLEQLQGKRADVLWCNARTVALGFYEKRAFTRIGAPFEIDGIGEHYVMFRRLHGNATP